MPVGSPQARAAFAAPSVTAPLQRPARPRLSTILLSLFFVLPAILIPHNTLADDHATSGLMDMSLEDLMKVNIDSVYGASRYKQKVTETPASVTIITADEIRRYGYRTLAEALGSVPGFYVTYDRDYSYLGVRGFGPPGDFNSRILIMVDGHQTNENIFGQGYLGTDFPVDIDLIDRVEVIRGPNSSVYVASGLLGVVNIVTKSVRDAKGLSISSKLLALAKIVRNQERA